jgi:hypothetical protein
MSFTQHLHQPSTRRAMSLVVGLSALSVVLGACQSGDKAADTGTGVASIAAPAASKSASAGSKESADSKRPRLRLDSTAREEAQLQYVYARCLKDQGVPMATRQTGPVNAEDVPVMSPKANKAPPAAAKACKSKLPIRPPELDEATNPNYTDDFREQIACMNKKGANIKGLPDNAGWTYVGSGGKLSPEKMDKVERECQAEAFSSS